MTAATKTSKKLDFKTSAPAPKSLRWIATLTYRTNAGPEIKQHFIDEISDLHDLVEDGPNFYLLASALIEPNPAHFNSEAVKEVLAEA